VVDNHHAALLAMIAEQLGCAAEDVVDFELNLCDVQPGVLGGAAEEFVFVGRLDNLASCYTALEVCKFAGRFPAEDILQEDLFVERLLE
jgi:aspartyl aminopeptidase